MAIDVSSLTDSELDALIGGDAPAAGGAINSEAVDYTSGAGFLERMAASFKSSPESAANYYKTKYEDVRVRGPEVHIRDKKKTGGKCPRATPNPAAQRADVGTCKPVSGSPKVSLCKVKSRGGGQWKFFKKNIKRKPGVVRRGRRKGKR